jgi:hypothetical protein
MGFLLRSLSPHPACVGCDHRDALRSVGEPEHVRLALDAKGILPACGCRTIWPESLAGNQSRDAGDTEEA